MSRKEIAAFAYRLNGHKIEVVLVTNREKSHWILPKGKPETHMTDSEVALMEAYEEGGITGTLLSDIECYRTSFYRQGEKIKLKVYTILIEDLLTKWPESKIRKRKVVSVKAALSKVELKPLRKCIQHLSDIVNERLYSNKNAS
jgi:8-oxo-dGTP pyrophosphatase MutT (NUDIX family)